MGAWGTSLYANDSASGIVFQNFYYAGRQTKTRRLLNEANKGWNDYVNGGYQKHDERTKVLNETVF